MCVRLEQVGSCVKTIKQIKRNLKRYDADGNAPLDFCEFLTLMLHDLNTSNPQETLRNVFLTFDEDRDGKIAARAQLKRTHGHTWYVRCPCARAKFVIKMADRDIYLSLSLSLEFVDVCWADPHPNLSGTEQTDTHRKRRRRSQKRRARAWNPYPTPSLSAIGAFF